MTVKERVVKEIEVLDERQLHEVEEYVTFLRFRSRFMPLPSYDEHQIAQLYREFGKEDKELAEEGMTEYAGSLIEEDRK